MWMTICKPGVHPGHSKVDTWFAIEVCDRVLERVLGVHVAVVAVELLFKLEVVVRS